MSRTLWFTARQALLIGLAALAYFGVRGVNESDLAEASENAGDVLAFERWFGIDIELGLQELVLSSGFMIDLANWIYIWAHWPLIAFTLVWLAMTRRDEFYELRNAMFISGAIGLFIFASYAVAPPRLFAAEYVDTVTQHSTSYRVLQPPSLVNRYAAVPSLHFGWNLLVGLTWRRVGSSWFSSAAAVVMAIAMAFAVVATANHWTFDVIAGAVVALTGLVLEKLRRDVVRRMNTTAAPSRPRDEVGERSPGAPGLVLRRSQAGPGRQLVGGVTDEDADEPGSRSPASKVTFGPVTESKC